MEIGGDTTKLTTALKSVNTDIRTTQSQLRDVNNLLKLDPGNTELVAQKHRLLADAVRETKEKLETLKAAAEQANEALSNFHTFMPDMIDLLGKGIRGNLGKLTGPMKELAGMLIPTTGAMESISSAGNGTNGNASLAARLDAMYEVVTKYLPRLADAQVVLDSGALVGELSDGLNRELGKAY